ncbi:MAG: extracellular solute-binding protein, partial [Oscillospiraceae bacterium]|nr:extracellular solute-binding protein [Oscillospiraceae bacterium]
MKKQLLAITLIAALLASFIASCKKTEDPNNPASSSSPGASGTVAVGGFLYVPTYLDITLPDNVIGEPKVIDGSLYYFAMDNFPVADGGEETYGGGGGGGMAVARGALGAPFSLGRGLALRAPSEPPLASDGELTPDGDEPIGGDEELIQPTYRMYRASLDGSSTTVIEGFIAPTAPAGYEGTGSFYINSFIDNGDGTIWIHESGQFGTYNENTRSFDGITVSYIRKLNLMGEQLAMVDASALVGDSTEFYIGDFAADKDGNIVMQASISGTNEMKFIAVAPDGTKLAEIPVVGWPQAMLAMPDGSIVAMISSDGQPRIDVVPIDVKGARLGASLGTAPDNLWQFNGVLPDGRILSHTDLALNAFKPGDSTAEPIVGWLDADVDSSSIQSVTVDGDDIYVSAYNIDYTVGRGSYVVTKLTKTPAAEVKQKTVLTLACNYLDGDLRNEILKFNKSDPDYRITVKDYSVYNTSDDYLAGQLKMNTEIIAGDVPDIIQCGYTLPVSTYTAKGVFEDLYPYLDGDTKLGGRGAIV